MHPLNQASRAQQVGLVRAGRATAHELEVCSRRGRMAEWADFYERLFNFREIRYFDIEGKLTGLKTVRVEWKDGKMVEVPGTEFVLDADLVLQALNAEVRERLRGATRGGKVVMVGLLPAGPQPVDISLAVSRELQLAGSFRFNGELDRVLGALADGSLRADPVVTQVFPVAQMLEAFELAGDPSRSGKVLLEF